MSDRLKLMCVLAHPDDESLGTGGILAKYVAEGVDAELVVATRGERGWTGDPGEYPGPAELGRIREAELRAATAAFGMRDPIMLPYIDGDLDRADPAAATALIAHQLRRFRPDVVVTFGPDGAYGHPDHIAISQLTTAALIAAAASEGDGLAAHRVSKLYFLAADAELGELWDTHFGPLVMEVDGARRTGVAWPDWAITTRIDASQHWQTVWRAVACHQTQLPNLELLAALPVETHQALWGRQSYYRAFSAVNGGRALETDLFAGLRR